MRGFVVVLVAGYVIQSVCAHAVSVNCSAQYQEALNEALRIKRECEIAVFYDCCQVITTAHLVNEVTNSPPPTSGIYEIGAVCPDLKLPFSRPSPDIDARCDMDTDEGGWLLIQRKVSGGTESFQRGWRDYEDGFGDLDGEFWYGLNNIHCLTTRDDVELRIEVNDSGGTTIIWTYQVFKVAGPEDNYRLTVGEGEGTNSHNMMASHNNRQFTTNDRDNDAYSSTNCAASTHGGWWYGACYSFVPNAQRIEIYNHGSTFYQSAEMKIRPKTCTPQKTCS